MLRVGTLGGRCYRYPSRVDFISDFANISGAAKGQRQFELRPGNTGAPQYPNYSDARYGVRGRRRLSLSGGSICRLARRRTAVQIAWPVA